MSANNVTHHEVNVDSFATIQSSSPQGLTENFKHPFRRFLYDYNAEIGEFFAMMIFSTVGSSNLAQILFRVPHSEGSMDISIVTGRGCALILAATIAVGTSGGHINPARDFGPRLFILTAGWRDMFKVYNHYFYVLLLSPIVDCIAAQDLYDYLVVLASIKRKGDRIGHR
ncbi:hypothetical protein DL89DRAFT_295652 [Linderina pennispora]|uniref:Aquaporin-like protein n=1 Tax=Linderina pennispora TaxID=61395 RepID=A0A1Y1VXZ4_9FUNG|nr:uncharacterized protein DL89DRAFT_295652 [Linderina pennispora]ORX66152.1 hypothetical protein DL89DRAFT_295652 [Linderina pennispora]